MLTTELNTYRAELSIDHETIVADTIGALHAIGTTYSQSGIHGKMLTVEPIEFYSGHERNVFARKNGRRSSWFFGIMRLGCKEFVKGTES